MFKKNIPGIVAVFETLLLFIMGVMGNKISEGLDIEPAYVVIFTGIGLMAMAVISYMNSSRIEDVLEANSRPKRGSVKNNVPEAKKTNRFFYQLIPKTMLGVFPLGILLGFFAGAIFPSILKALSLRVDIPFWYYLPFNLILSDAEALGIYVGVSTSILLAIFLDGYLGSALSIGFGFSFPVALIIAESNNGSIYHGESITFFGHVTFFALFGVLLIILTPLISKIKPSVIKALTQKRV